MQVTHFSSTTKEAEREKYLQEQEALRAQQLIDRYQDKPFHIKNRDNKMLIQIASWCCNVFSIILAFYFLFSCVTLFVPNLFAAAVLAILPLALWELLKRNAITGLAVVQFVNKRFSRPRFAVVCLIVGGSIYMTTIGGHQIMKDFTYAPTLANIDSIATFYDQEIAHAEEQIKSMQNSKGEILWNLRVEAEPVQQQITQLRQQKNEAIAAATADDKEKLATFNYDVQIDSWQFGAAAGSFDLLLIAMLFFLVYCDEREYFHLKSARPELFAQTPAQLAARAAQTPAQAAQVAAQPVQPYFIPPVPHPAPSSNTVHQPVRVLGFLNRQPAAQVVQDQSAQSAQVVHTQVVQNLEGVEYSREYSSKGVIDGRINHKTSRSDKWLSLAEVERRIKDYAGRVDRAELNYQKDPTKARAGVLENNEGWLNYWTERREEFFQ